ncbi:MAG: acyl-CoA thioesterase [Sphingobacteriaceae bacterium]|nr:acyl-CoA thioesterase [Cytophagaceae bacterium]
MLSACTEVKVRFSEVDSLGIVWHGHYLQYFEEGREGFGEKYGLGYQDFYREGFVTPIVSIQCDYKLSLRHGDRLLVDTQYVPTEAAKIKFRYSLLNAETGVVVAIGASVQVFLDKTTGLLQLTNPPFFEDWKRQRELL